VIDHRQGQVFQVIDALHPTSRFARSLDGRQKQRHQDADDCNHDQQLDERKAAIHSAMSLIVAVHVGGYVPVHAEESY
jgi:hypothetical protein